jgi:4-carboxymuconolactone decarboxylase
MDKTTYDLGNQTRRKVLGDRYVDAALAAADDFTRPLQDLITEFGWGATWGRPGLELKTRSIMNLAMLTALNRPHELRVHVRGAINNGLTRDEIREVLLHTAAYCGIPATMDAFRIAREVIEEMQPK